MDPREARLPEELLPEALPPEPLSVANDWFAEAWQRRDQPNPDAMVLATSTPDGMPSARVVLCKQIVPQPGFVVFYTNYDSHKGRELAANPRAAVVLHWDHLHRQVRVEGRVTRVPAATSDAYFASRPWQSRVGAWSSQQSQPLARRAELFAALEHTAQRLGTPSPLAPVAGPGTDYPIPRPEHWGGFQLWAEAVELWIEGGSRIHDRARWTRTLEPLGGDLFRTGPWAATRLQP
jgi:pyridoxamine 5'-phosphate oxidase